MYRIGKEEIDAVAKVINSGQLFRYGDPAQGHLQEVEKFEDEWAEKIGTKYALLMCGGGTSALTCALAGLGIGPGDEVLVPAYTWLATATAVLAVGGIPVLVEVDETLALDPEDVERRVGPNTRAMIPVHMSGRPADMESLMAVAKRHGLKVVEDSCQMVGGSYKGKRTGSWGDVGAFSFNYFKIISTGEGGAITTDDRTIYERAFMFHDSGCAFRTKAGEFSEPIFVAQQYRADEIQGAVARVQMSRLDGILGDLRAMRKRFEAELGDCLTIAPSNDPEGDCGVCVLFQFGSEEKARAFASAPGVGGAVGIDSGKHVYTNWEALAERRIMHRSEMNPFNFPSNQGLRMDYSAESCPRTLDFLRRTAAVGLHPDLTEKEVVDRIEACRTAAKSL
jgi:dTDP-4-amino-4,6-dideoxygalactose transaminase